MLTHSLVITIYNAPKDVALCLSSVEKSLDLSKTELVFADDASESETALILDEFIAKHPEVKLVRHEQNQGYLHTVNDGIRACTHDIITLLNSDTCIPKDFTPRILACFEKDEKIGVASPVLTHGNPFSVPLTLSADFIYEDRDVTAFVEKNNIKAKSIIPLYPDIVFPDGACFSVRRICFEEAGLFDEKYAPGYFEELDLCMKVVQKGYRAVFIDNLYVYHKSHASFGKKKTSEYMRRNRVLFHDTWGEMYRGLVLKNPKKQHKRRVFCNFYPLWYYCFVEVVLRISRIIPVSALRRKIRAKYL